MGVFTARILPDGNLICPFSIHTDTMIGDGVCEAAPGTELYDNMIGEAIPATADEAARWRHDHPTPVPYGSLG